ncbi:M23 family metallopeptidase [Nocardia sp. CC227C]|uniref:M23 family metallopeptidase n=1 Tax=Nocardia sp. CC227C TaxID=3044562 RepID=UPI00278BF3D2|nr:M23 family metallopeptidase [Nocardia sp. CC227C]
MPVTVPLSKGRALRRYRAAATRAVAVTAIAGASLSVLAAADQRVDGAPVGKLTAAPQQESPAHEIRPVANVGGIEIPDFIPVPPQVDDLLNGMAQDHRPRTVRPVAGPLSSGYGMRWGAMHSGLDFADGLGAPIAAVTDGTVIEAGPASGFGLWVRIQQDDGTVGVYGHMQDILVSVGQHVRAGDVIATVGSRGYSTGPHLHYEVHTDAGPIDPHPWLAARGVSVG